MPDRPLHDTSVPKTMAVGQRLNQLEGDLAPKTLVGHLPQSPRQLGALKHQVEADLALLRQEKMDLDVDTSAQSEVRQTMLSMREARLVSTLATIDAELARRNPFQKLGFVSFGVGEESSGGLLGFLKRRSPEARKKVETLDTVCDDMMSLQHLMEEYLHDPTALDPDRMAALISRFDRQAKIADRMAESLRRKPH
jgi:hypothetical protein